MAAGASWLVGAAVLRVLRAAGVPGPAPGHPVTSVTILFGLCCITVLGGVWSLGAPLGPGAAVAGAAVLALSATVLIFVPERRLRAAPVSRMEKARFGLLVAVILVAAAQTASSISVYDTSLYHIQAIRWIEQYPAVPGLANLYDRLAFSPPWFEAQALFDPVLFGGRPVFALNGLVFVAAVSFFLGGLRSPAGEQDLSRLLRLACVPAAFWLMRRWLSSASPDVAVALITWIVLLLLAEKIERGTGETLDQTAWVITALSSFAAVTKPSAAVLVLAPAWLIVRNLRATPRRALALAGLAAAVAAPFVVRNVIVSGCLIFPLPWTRLAWLSWAVPRKNVAATLAAVEDWARLPGSPHVSALDAGRWIPGWLHRLTVVEWVFLAALPVLAALHAVLALRRRGGSRPWPAGYPLLIALALAGSLFWLLTAPDPRFGWGSFPFLALLLAVPLAARWIGRLPGWAPVLLLTLVLIDQGRRVAAQDLPDLRSHWLWPVPPAAAETRSVNTGPLAVHLPVHGELCGDAPLPCTPALDPAAVPRGTTFEEGWTTANTSAAPSE